VCVNLTIVLLAVTCIRLYKITVTRLNHRLWTESH